MSMTTLGHLKVCDGCPSTLHYKLGEIGDRYVYLEWLEKQTDNEKGETA